VEVIKRRDKEAHPHAWNPEHGWKLLRLANGYREAVEEYYQGAVAANNMNEIMWFKILAGREPDPTPQHMIEPCEGEPPNRLDFMQRWSSTKTGDLLEFFLLDNTPGGILPQSSPHLDIFLTRYGDIIRFPIHPDNPTPPAHYLNALWNLRPAIFAGPRYVDIHNAVSAVRCEPNHAQSVKAFSIAINTHFKKEKVLEEIVRYVDALYANIGDTKDWRPRWDDIDDYVRVWAMRKSKGADGTSPGYQKIGNELAPEVCRTSDQKKDWAKARIEYVENVLAPLFERTKPTPR
jgi:hypothetical protein